MSPKPSKFLGFLALSFFVSANIFGAQPRIGILCDNTEANPTSEILRAASHSRDRFTVEAFSWSGAPADLNSFDLLVVEEPQALSAENKLTIQKIGTKPRLVVLHGHEIKGIFSAAETHEVERYWDNPSQDNYTGLFSYLLARGLGVDMPVPSPIIYQDQSFYHPDAPSFFSSFQQYRAWYGNAGGTHHRFDPSASTVAISFNRAYYTQKNLSHIDALIRAIEKRGANAIALMSKGAPRFDPYLIDRGKAIADVLIYHGERLNFVDYQAGLDQARRLDLPVLGVYLQYRLSAAQYLASNGGLAPDMTANLVDAERDGVFEPIVAGARPAVHDGGAKIELIPSQVEWRVDRALAWAHLRREQNRNKRVAFTFWSEGGGKANVGGDPDDFLDVPASLSVLLRQMKERGYNIGSGQIPDRDSLVRRMSLEASNVGNWAPAELARRVRSGAVALIPQETYKSWFLSLPQKLQDEVIKQWGPPPGKVMLYRDEKGKACLVIPKLQFGNVLVAPHPDWGYLQDSRALLSTGALPPHHQYLAFFLWLQKEWRADAWVSLFSNIVLQEGKAEGPAADDAIGVLLGSIPHIHPEKLGTTGGMSNKRKALALTPGWFNIVVPSGATESLSDLRALLLRYQAQSDPKLRADAEPEIRKEAERRGLGRELSVPIDTIAFPELLKNLEAYLAEIEREHMPHGSHVLGVAPEGQVLVAMVSGMLNGELSRTLENLSPAAKSKESDLLSSVVLRGQLPAAAVSTYLANLDAEKSHRVEAELTKAVGYAGRLRSAPREVDSILEALEAHRIEPGPMDEPLRNPDSLPPGRALYNFNQAIIPTVEAESTAAKQADALIAQYRARHEGVYPQKLGLVLWSAEIAKSHGVMEAEALYLLGARVVRDNRGNVIDVELIPREQLNRPRVDILITTSGVYRDHFSDKIELLAKAARLAAESHEEDNPVSRDTQASLDALIKKGESAERARQLATARVFAPAPNAYSPGIQFLAKSGDQRGTDATMADLYTSRFSHAYGDGLAGDSARGAFEQNLKKLDATTLSRTDHVNGVLDDPMPAGFLGGMNMAARAVNGGRSTDLFINDLRDADHPAVETLEHTLHRELRTRYLNPKWIEAMKQHGYDGARYMMDLTDNLSLWNTTTPQAVMSADWEQVKQVYVDDSQHLGLAKFFQKNNPFAKQVMLANLLQVAERGEWNATAAELTEVARQLAESAATNGIVCEANVCRNQKLTGAVAKALKNLANGAQLTARYQEAIDHVRRLPDADIAPSVNSATPIRRGPARPNVNSQAPSPSAAKVPPTVAGRVLETVTGQQETAIQTPQMRTILATVVFGLLLFMLGWARNGDRLLRK